MRAESALFELLELELPPLPPNKAMKKKRRPIKAPPKLTIAPMTAARNPRSVVVGAIVSDGNSRAGGRGGAGSHRGSDGKSRAGGRWRHGRFRGSASGSRGGSGRTSHGSARGRRRGSTGGRIRGSLGWCTEERSLDLTKVLKVKGSNTIKSVTEVVLGLEESNNRTRRTPCLGSEKTASNGHEEDL